MKDAKRRAVTVAGGVTAAVVAAALMVAPQAAQASANSLSGPSVSRDGVEFTVSLAAGAVIGSDKAVCLAPIAAPDGATWSSTGVRGKDSSGTYDVKDATVDKPGRYDVVAYAGTWAGGPVCPAFTTQAALATTSFQVGGPVVDMSVVPVSARVLALAAQTFRITAVDKGGFPTLFKPGDDTYNVTSDSTSVVFNGGPAKSLANQSAMSFRATDRVGGTTTITVTPTVAVAQPKTVSFEVVRRSSMDNVDVSVATSALVLSTGGPAGNRKYESKQTVSEFTISVTGMDAGAGVAIDASQTDGGTASGSKTWVQSDALGNATFTVTGTPALGTSLEVVVDGLDLEAAQATVKWNPSRYTVYSDAPAKIITPVGNDRPARVWVKDQYGEFAGNSQVSVARNGRDVRNYLTAGDGYADIKLPADANSPTSDATFVISALPKNRDNTSLAVEVKYGTPKISFPGSKKRAKVPNNFVDRRANAAITARFSLNGAPVGSGFKVDVAAPSTSALTTNGSGKYAKGAASLSLVTDAAGEVVFFAQSRTAGESSYSVTITSDVIASDSHAVTFKAPVAGARNLELRAPAKGNSADFLTVRGLVTDNFGNVMGGVAVRLAIPASGIGRFPNGGKEALTTSRTNGIFRVQVSAGAREIGNLVIRAQGIRSIDQSERCDAYVVQFGCEKGTPGSGFGASLWKVEAIIEVS